VLVSRHQGKGLQKRCPVPFFHSFLTPAKTSTRVQKRGFTARLGMTRPTPQREPAVRSWGPRRSNRVREVRRTYQATVRGEADSPCTSLSSRWNECSEPGGKTDDGPVCFRSSGNLQADRSIRLTWGHTVHSPHPRPVRCPESQPSFGSSTPKVPNPLFC
jgi:hypothetical protein